MCQILKFESFKLLIKNKGIFLVALYIALKMICMFDSTTSTHSPIMQQALNRYYQAYGGKLTEASIHEIQNKYDLINEAVNLQSKAFSDYDAQLITRAQLNQILDEVRPLIIEKRAFDKFYAYYAYCLENPEQRYLINTQAWVDVLSLKSPDFVLIVITLFLSGLALKNDLTKDIIQITKTTRYGYSSLLNAKLIVASGLAVLLGMITQLVNLLPVIINGTVIEGNSPLQSISLFSASPYTLTIWESFMLGSLIRILGLIYCSIIAVCLGELFRNVVLGCFSTLAIAVLPYFAFGSGGTYLMLPTITGLVQAFVYLLGRDNTEVPLTLDAMVRIVVYSVVIALLLCGIAKRHYCSAKRVKKVSAIIAIILLVTTVSGCTNTTEAVTMDYASNYSQAIIEAKDYFVYYTDKWMVTEKTTGRQYEFLNDPLEPEEYKQSLSYAKAAGNIIYFLYTNPESRRSIQSINLDTGERKTHFTDDLFGKVIKIFDVVIWEGPVETYESSLNKVVDFFILNNQIILIRGESITVVESGHEKLLYDGYFSNIASNGDRIFFTDEHGILCELDMQQPQVRRYSNIFPKQLKAIGNRLLYLDVTQGYALCEFDIEHVKTQILEIGTWESFQIVQNTILLIDSKRQLFYRQRGVTDLLRVDLTERPQEVFLLDNGNTFVGIYYDSVDRFSYRLFQLGDT